MKTNPRNIPRTAADVRNTLRDEYNFDLLGGPSKAIAHQGGGEK